MGQKTIALDEEAYGLLRREKKGGESFSDVVKRLAHRRRSILEFAGAWKKMPPEDLRKIEEAIRRGRELDLERQERLLKRMG